MSNQEQPKLEKKSKKLELYDSVADFVKKINQLKILQKTLKKEIKTDPTKKDQLREVTTELIKLEEQKQQILDGIIQLKKILIVKEKYKEIFPNESRTKSINRTLRETFTPQILLRDHFQILDTLATQITKQKATQAEKDLYFETQEKVNELLTVINNLGMDIPAYTRKPFLKIQRTAVELPIKGAKFIARSLIKGKQIYQEKRNGIEHTVDEYILLKALKNVQKKLLKTQAFGPHSKKTNNLHVELANATEEELIPIIANLLKQPFEIVDNMGLDTKKPENHPKKILEYIFENSSFPDELDGEESTRHFAQRLKEFEFAIDNHEIMASVLNMEVCYWRRFALLNLEVFRSSKKRLTEILRAITFQTSKTVHGVVNIEKLRNKPNIRNVEELRQWKKSKSGDFNKSKQRGHEPVENFTPTKIMNSSFLGSFLETSLYETQDWEITQGPLAKALEEAKIPYAFCSFNKGNNETDDKNPETNIIPQKAFAILSKSNKEGQKFDVSLQTHDTFDSTKYQHYHEKMLELYIHHNGDIKELKRSWKNEVTILDHNLPGNYTPEFLLLLKEKLIGSDYDINKAIINLIQELNEKIKKTNFSHPLYEITSIEDLIQLPIEIQNQFDINNEELELYKQTQTNFKHINEYNFILKLLYRDSTFEGERLDLEFNKSWKSYTSKHAQIPSFQRILTRVQTLPFLLLQDKIHELTSVNDLKLKLEKQTDDLRSKFLASSAIITYGVDENGNLTVHGDFDHGNGDGKFSEQYIASIVKRMLQKSKPYLNSEQQPLKINTEVIETTATEEEIENEANHEVQVLVNSEGILRISDQIGKLVRKMSIEGIIDPDSKLKNPAVVMQLILIHHYQETMSNMVDENGAPIMDTDKNVGMLIGNKDISSDLDLAPMSQGLDIKLFMTMNERQQQEYLKNLALKLEIALNHTNMTLIKDVVDNIPNPKIQEIANKVSFTKPLIAGARSLAGEFMISHFGLPRIIDGEIIIDTIEGYNYIDTSGPAMIPAQTAAATFVAAGMINGEFHLSTTYKNKDNKQAVETAEQFTEIIQEYNNIYQQWQDLPLVA